MAVSEAIKLSKNLSYGTIWLIWAGAKLGINSNQLKLSFRNISTGLTDRFVLGRVRLPHYLYL